MSIIGSGIAAYQNLQMDMISKMSVGSENMINEVPFYDEGYISTQIGRLKREHEDVARDLKIASDLNLQSDYEQNRRLLLKSRLEKIELKLLYYAMNSFESLGLCRELINGKKVKAADLVQALECYQMGETEQAERLFYHYFRDNSVESALFLANKIYGKLLMKAGKEENALRHMEYAVQLNVNDIELLVMLERAYKKTGRQTERAVVSEVCRILGQGV